LTPLANVNVSANVPPTSDSILVALIPATVTAFGPVMLQLVAALGPVSVSVPEPPVRLVIPENVVVVFSVPALAPVIAHALVPFVAANVSVPPPPAMVPAKLDSPPANVK